MSTTSAAAWRSGQAASSSKPHGQHCRCMLLRCPTLCVLLPASSVEYIWNQWLKMSNMSRDTKTTRARG
jgi:hypothetical protein